MTISSRLFSLYVVFRHGCKACWVCAEGLDGGAVALLQIKLNPVKDFERIHRVNRTWHDECYRSNREDASTAAAVDWSGGKKFGGYDYQIVSSWRRRGSKKEGSVRGARKRLRERDRECVRSNQLSHQAHPLYSGLEVLKYTRPNRPSWMTRSKVQLLLLHFSALSVTRLEVQLLSAGVTRVRFFDGCCANLGFSLGLPY